MHSIRGPFLVVVIASPDSAGTQSSYVSLQIQYENIVWLHFYKENRMLRRIGSCLLLTVSTQSYLDTNCVRTCYDCVMVY